MGSSNEYDLQFLASTGAIIPTDLNRSIYDQPGYDVYMVDDTTNKLPAGSFYNNLMSNEFEGKTTMFVENTSDVKKIKDNNESFTERLKRFERAKDIEVVEDTLAFENARIKRYLDMYKNE